MFITKVVNFHRVIVSGMSQSGLPPPCGEGTGVGVDGPERLGLGTWSRPRLPYPPPFPSPARGEVTHLPVTFACARSDEPHINARVTGGSTRRRYISHQPIDPRPLPDGQQTRGDSAAGTPSGFGRRVAEGPFRVFSAGRHNYG